MHQISNTTIWKLHLLHFLVLISHIDSNSILVEHAFSFAMNLLDRILQSTITLRILANFNASNSILALSASLIVAVVLNILIWAIIHIILC